MNETGIVRRMDELGRIVIPKEIRRSLRLAEGEEMEILPDGEKLIVRKHSRFSEAKRAAESTVAALADATGCEAFLVAADEVAAAHGKGVGRLRSRALTEEFSALARSRKTQTFRRRDGFCPVDGVSLGGGCMVGAPVTVAGDVTGQLFLVGEGAEEYVRLLEFAARVLGDVCAD